MTAYLFEITDDAMAGDDQARALRVGDLALIEPGAAVPGDIVLAEIEGEPVVRFLMVEDGRRLLRAASSAFPDIPAPALIDGVVTELRRVLR
jgi:SOS-response transcriptional repressor LexA